MKVYFEKFGSGADVSYLTPFKHYEVIQGGTEESSPDFVQINDDVGDSIWVTLEGQSSHTCSLWKILPEETKAKSASDIVASLESERNALANSIDSVNELLDSLAVPKAETLVERVASALTPELETAGTTVARIVKRRGHIDSGLFPRKPVRVSLMTESGDVVYFLADLDA